MIYFLIFSKSSAYSTECKTVECSNKMCLSIWPVKLNCSFISFLAIILATGSISPEMVCSSTIASPCTIKQSQGTFISLKMAKMSPGTKSFVYIFCNLLSRSTMTSEMVCAYLSIFRLEKYITM